MFRLDKCPYCGFKFDYTRCSMATHSKDKTFACRKCGKLMSVSYKKSAFVMGVIFFVALIAMNTLYLSAAKNTTIIPNLVMTIIFIVLYMVLVPLLVRFGKLPGQEEPPQKLKKNRHRHKKDKPDKIEFDENPLQNTTFDK